MYTHTLHISTQRSLSSISFLTCVALTEALHQDTDACLQRAYSPAEEQRLLNTQGRDSTKGRPRTHHPEVLPVLLGRGNPQGQCIPLVVQGQASPALQVPQPHPDTRVG